MPQITAKGDNFPHEWQLRTAIADVLRETGLVKHNRSMTAKELLDLLRIHLRRSRLEHLAPADPRLDDDIPF